MFPMQTNKTRVGIAIAKGSLFPILFYQASLSICTRPLTGTNLLSTGYLPRLSDSYRLLPIPTRVTEKFPKSAKPVCTCPRPPSGGATGQGADHSGQVRRQATGAEQLFLQLSQLVANLRRLLEFEVARVFLHQLLQTLDLAGG